MRKFFSRVAVCVMAILAIALCGCDDLGAYADENEYFGSFDDIVLISGTLKQIEEYSVEKFFYSEQSREDFLEDADGVYHGVAYDDYVYMAIPFDSNIDMDSIALYMRSQEDATVYINVFLTDKIPSNWKAVSDNVVSDDSSSSSGDTDEEGIPYDDPDYKTRIGDVTIHLKKEEWNSFVLERFLVGGTSQESIQINSDQYVLLQIRNNSGARVFDKEKKLYVDPQTGLALPKAEITMTNLLVRALSVENAGETEGGE